MNNIVNENKRCPACNVFGRFEVVPYIDADWNTTKIFEGMSIEYCQECGFGFSVPEMEDDTVNHFYTHIYRGVGSPYFTVFSAMSRPISHNYRSLAQLILSRHFVEFESGDCFVDIGPGSGESFMSAEMVLLNPKMYAVELSDGAATAYKRIYGIDTFENIKELIKTEKNPKIILSSHSLEHFKLINLRTFLTEIKNSLGPGGVFIAEVPYVDMRIHSHLRIGDSPHFLFFSKIGLSKILELSGFDVLFLDSCGPKYDDWWKAVNIKAETRNPWLKNIIRTGFSKLPMSVKQFIKKIYYSIHADVINFTVDDFSYGGNRTCLRVVARPKIH